MEEEDTQLGFLEKFDGAWNEARFFPSKAGGMPVRRILSLFRSNEASALNIPEGVYTTVQFWCLVTVANSSFSEFLVAHFRLGSIPNIYHHPRR